MVSTLFLEMNGYFDTGNFQQRAINCQLPVLWLPGVEQTFTVITCVARETNAFVFYHVHDLRAYVTAIKVNIRHKGLWLLNICWNL